MTDIKDYVCTVEQAKKLKELEIDREYKDSVFFWGLYDGVYSCLQTEYVSKMEEHLGIPLYKGSERLPAYTLQELFDIANSHDYEHGTEILDHFIDDNHRSDYTAKILADEIILTIGNYREFGVYED